MNKFSRRSFIKSASASTAGALFIPGMISASPNSKLNFAVIGVGGRGRASWTQVPSSSIVAMCDVDDREVADDYKNCPKAKKYKTYQYK